MLALLLLGYRWAALQAAAVAMRIGRVSSPMAVTQAALHGASFGTRERGLG